MADVRPDPDPAQRFAGRAGDYARHRPGYPPAIVDALLEGLGPPAEVRAVDVGAGTGISAGALAERGVRVVALEPSAAMRAAASAHPLVTWRDGRAEATGLATASVDLVLCAQSFHWLDVQPALAELRRVLRPGGRLAVVWNLRDDRDGVSAAYRDALVPLVGDAPAQTFALGPALDATPPGFAPARVVAVPHRQRHDLEGLVGRALSSSHVPRGGEVHDELLARLHALHARHADASGAVELAYVARAHLWERMGSGDDLVRLRPVCASDLPRLHALELDLEARRQAAFTSADAPDFQAFRERWERLLHDASVSARAVLVDGELAGQVARFRNEGHWEVTYWIDRNHRGRGRATRALALLLAELPERPVRGRCAADNGASRRVLEKCGFRVVARERSFAPARGEEIEELVLELS